MAGMLDRVFIAVPDLETILKLKDESPNLGDVTRLGRRDSRLEACRFGERLPRSPTRAAGHSLNHSSTMSARDSRRYQRRSRSPRGYSDLPDSETDNGLALPALTTTAPPISISALSHPSP